MHLQEFNSVCEYTKPAKVKLERIKMKAFPFSLQGAAKIWIFDQEASKIDTWVKVEKLFLEKYFPASRTSTLKRAINNITQKGQESFSEYWERYNKILNACPHHNLSRMTLIDNFYQGLMPQERWMLDAAAGGALMNKLDDEAWALMELIASNGEQITTRSNSVPVRAAECSKEGEVSEVTTNMAVMDKKLDDVCAMVQRMIILASQPPQEQAAATHASPEKQQTMMEDVNAYGAYNQNGFNRNNNFRSNFNQGGQPGNNFNKGDKPYITTHVLAEQFQTLQKKTDERFAQTGAALQKINEQLGEMATTLKRLDSKGSGKLPSQVIPNPKLTETLKAISEIHEAAEVKEGEEELEAEPINKPWDGEFEETDWEECPDLIPSPEGQVWDIYGKSEVNIPLLNSILNEPNYQRFLLENEKERKKDVRAIYGASVGPTISAYIKKKIPPKCIDPGVFTVPCVIGKSRIVRAMLDLGASINVMSDVMYKAMKLRPLKKASFGVELADHTVREPEGILENILIQVQGLIFPTDFVVLNMERKISSKSFPIILGRSFMKTSNTKIDVGEGTLSMEFDGKRVHFDISNIRQKPETVVPVSHKHDLPKPYKFVDNSEEGRNKRLIRLEDDCDKYESRMKKIMDGFEEHESKLKSFEETLRILVETKPQKVKTFSDELKIIGKGYDRLSSKVGQSNKLTSERFTKVEAKLADLESKVNSKEEAVAHDATKEEHASKHDESLEGA